MECWRIELECEVHGIATTWKNSGPLFSVVFNPPRPSSPVEDRNGLPGWKKNEDAKRIQPQAGAYADTPQRQYVLPTPTRPNADTLQPRYVP